MKRTLLALPFVFLAACEENKADNATCYVDLTDPQNVTATVKFDITGNIMVSAKNFEETGNGNLEASREDVNHEFNNKNIPFLTLRFNSTECRLSLMSTGMTYPMEIIGGDAPEAPSGRQ